MRLPPRQWHKDYGGAAKYQLRKCLKEFLQDFFAMAKFCVKSTKKHSGNNSSTFVLILFFWLRTVFGILMGELGRVLSNSLVALMCLFDESWSWRYHWKWSKFFHRTYENFILSMCAFQVYGRKKIIRFALIYNLYPQNGNKAMGRFSCLSQFWTLQNWGSHSVHPTPPPLFCEGGGGTGVGGWASNQIFKRWGLAGPQLLEGVTLHVY